MRRSAAIATVPESTYTLRSQVGQLAEGRRRVVMFPKGQRSDIPLPPGIQTTHDRFGNSYAYDPAAIHESDIKAAAENNKLPQILGGLRGMGAPDKSALQGSPIPVVARAPDGTEMQSAITDYVNLPKTLLAAQDVIPYGGFASIESPESVIAQRRGQYR